MIKVFDGLYECLHINWDFGHSLYVSNILMFERLSACRRDADFDRLVMGGTIVTVWKMALDPQKILSVSIYADLRVLNIVKFERLPLYRWNTNCHLLRISVFRCHNTLYVAEPDAHSNSKRHSYSSAENSGFAWNSAAGGKRDKLIILCLSYWKIGKSQMFIQRLHMIKDSESFSLRKEWNYPTVREDRRHFDISNHREISISAQ
jgi:hypothetical protein